MSDCIFCKIANGAIPVQAIYEDEAFLAFWDTNPQSPLHALVIPREHFETFLDINSQDLLGKAMIVVQKVSKTMNIADAGFRVVINTRENGGQTVNHMHIHILGGRFMQWPPG